MATSKPHSFSGILALGVISSMVSASHATFRAPPDAIGEAVEQRMTSQRVLDKSSEQQLGLMLLIHRSGLPLASTVPGVEPTLDANP